MTIDCWPDTNALDGLVPASLFGDSGKVGIPAPEDWYTWVTTLFPRYTTAPFAKRHAEMWEWAWAIEPDSSPDPFVAVWPRGGAKSSTAELVTVAVGVRGKRKYGWYVRATQDAADTSVQNIGGLLESDSIARHYPLHGERELGKFGDPRGWRRNRLRTAGGFTIDALGLDTAARGLKVDEDRPDFIILDDIDEKHDTLKISGKKIATITTSLLPAMAANGGVLPIQNLIIPHGFFARMVNGKADYLLKRHVSGPHPAVAGMEVEYQRDPASGMDLPVIVKGKATWAGQNLAACQHLLNTIGLDAFKLECQHDVFGTKEGAALRFHPHHIEDLTDERAKALIQSAIRSRSMSLIGGIDFGSWRFGFVLRVVDSAGRVHQVAEYFSQREGLEHRARAIDAICKHYGCAPGFPIWGDVANQTDIMEINLALTRIKSKYAVLAVAVGNKGRAASVERLNDLLDRKALMYRRDVSQAVNAILIREFNPEITKGTIRPEHFREWRAGYTSSSPGERMQDESRLRWEVKEWAYPPTVEGDEQDQDPDDASADGADLIAADRYCLMSWWSMTQEPKNPKGPSEDRDTTTIRGGQPVLGTTRDAMWQRFEQEQKARKVSGRSVFRRGKDMRKVDL